MDLSLNCIIWLYLIYLPMQTITALNHTEKIQIVVPEQPPGRDKPVPPRNITIEKLVQEQTEIIKKIVSGHREAIAEYPIVTKKEIKPKEESERQSIEELRKKCDHLFHQPAANKNNEGIAERSEMSKNRDQIVTAEAFGPHQKPPFLQKPKPEATSTPAAGIVQEPKLPPSASSPGQVEQISQKQALNYFILTRNRTTVNNSRVQQKPDALKAVEANADLQKSSKPQSSAFQTVMVQNPDTANVRYVQLEPVILQRMLLNNGRMLFYWYKSLPIPVLRYQQPLPIYSPSAALNPSPQIQQGPALYSAQVPNLSASPSTAINTKFLSPYSAQVPNLSASPSTAINTKFLSPLSNINPSQSTNGPPLPLQQHVYAPNQVPHYDIEYGPTKNTYDGLFRKQMKFVVPIQYPPGGDEAEPIKKHPWLFDPYAYYPKPLQPATVNVPLPYLPTFHMIKTLTLPENITRGNNAQN